MNKIVKNIFWYNWWVAFLFQHFFILFWATREYLIIKNDKKCTFGHVFNVHAKTVFEKLMYFNEYKKKMQSE